jgi:hypothetical protein
LALVSIFPFALGLSWGRGDDKRRNGSPPPNNPLAHCPLAENSSHPATGNSICSAPLVLKKSCHPISFPFEVLFQCTANSSMAASGLNGRWMLGLRVPDLKLHWPLVMHKYNNCCGETTLKVTSTSILFRMKACISL